MTSNMKSAHERERRVVAAMYPNQEWKDRVKEMSDDEILTIYQGRRAYTNKKAKEEITTPVYTPSFKEED